MSLLLLRVISALRDWLGWAELEVSRGASAEQPGRGLIGGLQYRLVPVAQRATLNAALVRVSEAGRAPCLR